MKYTNIVLLLIGLWSAGQAQSKNKNMNPQKNFACDIETAVCAPTENRGIEKIKVPISTKVKLIYYTDPICSACWAIEPTLKKFKLEYGDYVEIIYKMGGLLPGWKGFADQSNGISKPSDVAHHWEEVGSYSGMSIDGDVWLEDPLTSSYPPSIAFKAMQEQGAEKAISFLRIIREMVFLNKRNITNEAALLEAVALVGGDSSKFLKDYNSDQIQQRFYEEIKEGRSLGIRGFPSFIFVDQSGNGYRISGTSGYENYVTALEKAYGKPIEAKKIALTALELIQKYGYLATREISFILSKDEEQTIIHLETLVKKGLISKEVKKYGSFWRISKDQQ